MAVSGENQSYGEWLDEFTGFDELLSKGGLLIYCILMKYVKLGCFLLINVLDAMLNLS